MRWLCTSIRIAALGVAVTLATLAFSPARAAVDDITTIAGGGVGDGGPAANATLYGAGGLATDSAGNLYIADPGICTIREVSGGAITTVAGNGTCGYSGDGGPAMAAALQFPLAGIAVDGAGTLYVADPVSCRIRAVTAGTITTIAGDGTCGYSGDGGAATAASLNFPTAVAVDNTGRVYIADTLNCRVREISGGTIATVAGNGTCGYSGDGSATGVSLNEPQDVVADGAGSIYIADGLNCRVREVTSGTLTTVAGNGSCTYAGDGGAATDASLSAVMALARDGAGNLFVADTQNCRVRKVSSGTITTVIGNGDCSYAGDGGPATAASVNGPQRIAIDASGSLYLNDAPTCRVRIVSSGTITAFAGNGTCAFGGDGGPATSAGLDMATGVAIDADGNVYIADRGQCRIREVTGGTIMTVAGNGACTFSGDGGPATSASLYYPQAVAVDGNGDVYIGEYGGCRIRALSGGTITTVAGDGTCGYSGDGGPATQASLNTPQGLAIGGDGSLYIADGANCAVRKVSGGIITTVAGNGTCAYSGDGGPASSAGISSSVMAVAIDTAGNLYLADGCTVRKVTAGIISAFAGTGLCTSTGDGGPATSATVDFPVGLATDVAGNVYFSENDGTGQVCRVRRVSGGVIQGLAGNGQCAYSGDGGPASSAGLASPKGVAVDPSGKNVYIADGRRIRFMDPPSTATLAPSVGGVAELPDIATLRSESREPGFGLEYELGTAAAMTVVLAVTGTWVLVRRRRRVR